GFTEATGGLLRESDLERRRRAFTASPAAQERFLAPLGVSPPAADTLSVSLFCYENAALAGLLDAWRRGSRPVRCLVPPGRCLADLERFARRRLEIGDAVRVGRLELCVIPFVPQPEYDELLWSCDLNCVRGEDSFVRAQWAARPMLWHIYPQQENAHRAKLTAFLDAWCAGLPGPVAAATREFFLAWNGFGQITDDLWERWLAVFPALRLHTGEWREKLTRQQDLCSRLMQFCRSRL
ncbi:MAG: elongation factor P maturation arginine rhamnosyltransferase EarP, partial [Candidatus Accumulibacter sp.]|nr:elongation factor P maturation arginine rhamnosyltransferase EarP [Accumulibacter sp.]